MRKLLPLLVVIFAFVSCKQKYSQSIKSDNLNPWIYPEQVRVSFQPKPEGSETLRTDILVEHNGDFPFENLYIKYHILAQGDTIGNGVKSLQLQDQFGQWIGKQKKKKQYRSTHVLMDGLQPDFETLDVTVTQYSRMDTLPGIRAITIGLAAHHP